MPDSNTRSDHLGWKAYSELLGHVATVLIIIAVIAALVSAGFYLWKNVAIEQISHRRLSPGWTCLLLFIPIVIQLLVFSRLRKRILQAIADVRVRAYFKFYFGRMAASLLTYTLLWLCYVAVFALGFGPWVVWAVSWAPLAGILFLMGIVVHATFLITKTSFNDGRLLLTEDEVSSCHGRVCSELRTGTSSEVEIIRRWMRKDRDCKVHRAALKREIADLDVAHLTEALNRLIGSRRFYDDIPPSFKSPMAQLDNPLPADIEMANRRFLNLHLLNLTSTPAASDAKGRAAQKKLLRQKGQRDGVAMFPFYTMVFFFSIFLCVAYLFAFAFAFEDRYVQLTNPAKQISLFMSDDLLEDAQRNTSSVFFRPGDFTDPAGLAGKLEKGEDPVSTYLRTQLTAPTRDLLRDYSGMIPPPAPLQSALLKELNRLLRGGSLYDKQRFEGVMLREETGKLLSRQDLTPDGLIRLNRLLVEDAYPVEVLRSSRPATSPAAEVGNGPAVKLRKMFYFTSGEAGILLEAPDTSGGGEKYIAEINKASLESLVSQIRDSLDNGGVLRVELFGRADDRGVARVGETRSVAANRNTYASNYEVAAARAMTVRHALVHKLLERNTEAADLSAIEWAELPLSNDASLEPREPGADAEDAIGTIGLVTYAHAARETNQDQKLGSELLRELNAKAGLGRVNRAWRVEIQQYWKRLSTLAEAGKLSQTALNELYNEIEDWNELKGKGDVAAAARRKDHIERELFRHEDLAGSKRAVEAFLYEAAPRENTTSPHYKRMALMDYLYFAVYTITTTGYGDIKPTTPYSKFMCTLANITEIFFIVVFFNTLFSLKKEDSAPA